MVHDDQRVFYFATYQEATGVVRNGALIINERENFTYKLLSGIHPCSRSFAFSGSRNGGSTKNKDSWDKYSETKDIFWST